MARLATRAEQIAAAEALAFPAAAVEAGERAEVTMEMLAEVARMLKRQEMENFTEFDWRELGL